MTRAAFVALDLDEARAAPPGACLVAPPEVAPGALWSDAEEGPHIAGLQAGIQAKNAVAGAGVEEIFCTPESGWAIATAARSGGLEARVVMTVSPRHAELVRELEPGVDHFQLQRREALLAGLRDAHEVRGDAATLELLRKATPLAIPPETPAWSAQEQPGVTAVVTHKDLGRFLPQCLASLRNQTVRPEIVLIDDGSGPEGRAAVEAEQRKDPSLRVVVRENRGAGDARNTGVDLASHELVLIVDADNLMRPRMIERLREALRRRPWASAATAGFRAFPDGLEAAEWRYAPLEISARVLFFRNTAGDVCALHRREALREVRFMNRNAISEDWELWLRYAERGLRTVAVQETLFDYRMRPDSKLRSRPPILDAGMRPLFATMHPALVARHAHDLALLAGAELYALQQREREAMKLAARLQEAERERDELKRSVAELLQRFELERSRLEFELREMSSSSAVRLARALRGLSPRVHRVVGEALRTMLRS